MMTPKAFACWRCGTHYPTGSRACHLCGRTLREVAAPLRIPYLERIRMRPRTSFPMGEGFAELCKPAPVDPHPSRRQDHKAAK
jgi:hypothetical protein